MMSLRLGSIKFNFAESAQLTVCHLTDDEYESFEICFGKVY